jgi:type IV pilus assembly protein PilB
MIAGRPKLGAFLIERQILTDSQLETAIRHQIASGCRLGRALIDLGFCTDADIARALAEQLEIPFVDLDETPPAADCVTLLPPDVALEYGVLPLRIQGKRLLVAVLDPYDIRIDEVLRQATGLLPALVLAPESQIQRFLRLYCSESCLGEAHPGGPEEIEEVQSEEGSELRVDQLAAASEQTSVIRIVNSLIADAARRGASDLHVEPGEAWIRVRCRIDGRMYPVTLLPANLLPSLVARFKIMSGMDISESRKPQDGSCTLKVEGQTLELRVSTIRGVQGEIVVARLLFKEAGTHDLGVLGFQPEMLQDLHRLLAARHGMLLITGPTGSGKTTTLYAALNHLNQDDINIITIEDPVESKLPGINHIEVHDRAGRTFAASLRSVLRQDPDVIMLGEIRDAETAEIACRSALTGHLVLSSLHTPHTLGAVARLLDIGLEPWIVAACLNGVLAQRLVRRNCDQCTAPYTPPPAVQKAFDSRYGSLEGGPFQKGRGCTACNGTGSKGRLGVYELLAFDERMRDFLIQGPHLDELKQYVLQHGFHSIEDDAFRKARMGLIAPEEILRLGFALATEVADMSPALASFNAAPFGKAAASHPPRPAPSSVPSPAVGEPVVVPPPVEAALLAPPGEGALLAPPVDAATPEPAVITAVAEKPTEPSVRPPAPAPETALDQGMLAPAIQSPVDEPALTPRGERGSEQHPEEAPPLLLIRSPVREKARPAPGIKVKQPAAAPGRLLPFQIRSMVWDQRRARGAAIIASLCCFGVIAVCSHSLWPEAPVHAQPAHPQTTAGGSRVDPAANARSTAAVPKPPARSKNAFAGDLLDPLPGVASLLPPPSPQAWDTAAAGAPGSRAPGSGGEKSPTPGTAPGAPVASPPASAAGQVPEPVWCCPGGRYYHRRHCRRVEKRMLQIARSVALREGKQPCPSCRP